MKKYFLPYTLIFCLFILSSYARAGNIDEYSLYIDRSGKELYVLKPDGSVLWKKPCGIGRGGLKQKRNMADSVTPTGQFKIDIILYEKADFNAVSDRIIDKYKQKKKYHGLVSNKEGLSKLFRNMNRIDFNRDGKSDKAYGIAYIGLDSDNAITGPKLKPYHNGPQYWFSIALHGTPNESNVGKARSGGCVHVNKADLTRLIEEGIVKIGTKVTIADNPPKN